MRKVDIAEFLKVGLGVFVATRDSENVPHGVAGSALVLEGDNRAVVFVPEYECAQLVDDIHANGAIAVLVDQPTTHRGYQLKGRALAVRDDGTGFSAADRARASLGLVSMRERVRLVGGELDIVSRPDHGTSVVAWVPLREAA